ncbi:hypothetical protein HU200_046960 [Digitaria exilis]|uniref:Uncharacterized protein n=1 Tax=Digitaria exilis TaxID=1010633 RepID=A0A835EAL7_9POAL|nr:hypothetical protein HU200_046960 [Digitaria exilis]
MKETPTQPFFFRRTAPHHPSAWDPSAPMLTPSSPSYAGAELG